MKRVSTMILVLMMALSLCACGSNGSGNDGNNDYHKQNRCEIALNDYCVMTDYWGNSFLMLFLDVTNKEDISLEARHLANPIIYQDGAQVNDASWAIDDEDREVFPTGLEDALQYDRKIQSGATATVVYKLSLKNVTDDVSLEVYGGEQVRGGDGEWFPKESERNVVFSDTLKLD